MEAVIAIYSYRSGNIVAVIAFKSYCSDSKTKAIACNAVTFCRKVTDQCRYLCAPVLYIMVTVHKRDTCLAARETGMIFQA